EISCLNEIPGTEKGNPKNWNAAKILMWQDPLAGLFDYAVKGIDLSSHYAKEAAFFEKVPEAKDPYGLFKFSALIARALELKAGIGCAVTAAYKAGDKKRLTEIVEKTIPELIKRIEALRVFNREYWMANIKPLGWEVMDLRYGTLLARLDTAAYRIRSWLEGAVAVIEELEEERLPFSSQGLSECNCYGRIAMASRISSNIGY
ncbi:MAG: hypothetical protein LBC62_01635, partial [Treponema sp.]|nr:hypothetical protein [Treponema sp.]